MLGIAGRLFYDIGKSRVKHYAVVISRFSSAAA